MAWTRPDKLALWTLIVAIIILAWTLFADVWNWRGAAAAAIPQLQYVSVSSDKGDAILTVHNSSPETAASIYEFRFIVTDPATLQKIEQQIRKPKDPTWGEGNQKDVVVLRHGDWFTKDRYEFWTECELHIKPAQPNTFRVAIEDKKLFGLQLLGTLQITVRHGDKDLPFSREGVCITPKQSIPDDDDYGG
jgi:hypothetical protein